MIDLRLGQWQDVLADVTCDSLIFDAPYSAKTHESDAQRYDGRAEEGLAPEYTAMTPELIRAFCEAWLDPSAPRCRGWQVSITDSVLVPTWIEEAERMGRYAFAPVPCVITGMSCRMQGDGPSSWAVYACVSRPRSKEFATWGTLPGAYVVPRANGAGGGRGKPMWLMNALVRDYSRPGDLVCDPFAGWGSTLWAALGNGRRAIGAEVDPEVHAEATRRLDRPVIVDLFAGVA